MLGQGCHGRCVYDVFPALLLNTTSKRLGRIGIIYLIQDPRNVVVGDHEHFPSRSSKLVQIRERVHSLVQPPSQSSEDDSFVLSRPWRRDQHLWKAVRNKPPVLLPSLSLGGCGRISSDLSSLDHGLV